MSTRERFEAATPVFVCPDPNGPFVSVEKDGNFLLSVDTGRGRVVRSKGRSWTPHPENFSYLKDHQWLDDILVAVQIERKIFESLELIPTLKLDYIKDRAYRYLGYETVLDELGSTVIDCWRGSLLVQANFDPNLWVLIVEDPSTGNFVHLRVPPTIATAHRAWWWTFGFSEVDPINVEVHT